MSRHEEIQELQEELAQAHADAESATDPYDAAGFRLLASELAKQLDQARTARPFSEYELTYDAPAV